jgi:hypothetical protein
VLPPSAVSSELESFLSRHLQFSETQNVRRSLHFMKYLAHILMEFTIANVSSQEIAKLIFLYLFLEIVSSHVQTIKINSLKFKAIFTNTTAVSIVSIWLDRFVHFALLSRGNLTSRYIIG